MNVTEAAAELGVTPEWLRHLARNGKIAASRKGRDWFFPNEGVKIFQNSRLRNGANPLYKELTKRGLISG